MRKIYVLFLLLGGVYGANAQTHLTGSHSDSLYHLGLHYFQRTFTLPDIPKAKSYLLSAAKEKHVLAMEWLGELYTKDSLTGASSDSALFWLNAAAAAGDAHAWYKLGMIYKQGMNHIPQDFVKSADCFYKGMRQGDKNCENGIAYYLYKGLSHRQNYDSAFILFQDLAIHNQIPGAMYYLGLCYRNGYGRARNLDSAKYWLIQAVNLNNHEARKELLIKTPENPVEPLIAPVKILDFNVDISYYQSKRKPPLSPVGVYTGYAIRYDWSGRHIINILPVRTVLKKRGKNFLGIWIEGGDSLAINVVSKSGILIFNNSQYYPMENDDSFAGSQVHWQFKNSPLQFSETEDSIFITGKIQRYNPLRKEPGTPLYICLTKLVTLSDGKFE